MADRHHVPAAWDPACPAKYVVFDADKKLNTLWSDQSGCNNHELSALIRIIQAHKDYHDAQLQSTGARSLGEACRESIRDCLEGWEREKKPPNKDTQEHNNIELLKLTLAVLHLSDIFLPLLQPHHAFDSDHRARNDPFHKAGAVTASVVRFLRYHYDSPAMLHPDIADMLQAEQPELFGEGMTTRDGTLLYWSYVETCVVRGCLTQAWEALERHSLYQNSQSILDSAKDESSRVGDDLLEQATEIVRDFLVLKQLFRCAPLPGGRSDTYDDLVHGPDDEMQDENNEDEENNVLVGLSVTPQDYKHWEPKAFSSIESGGDYPLVYMPDAAIRKHKDWQQYVEEQVRPHLPFNRVPQLKRLLDIVTGNFDAIVFSSWSERLCAHLLYQNPSLRPRQIPVLAFRYMQRSVTHQVFDAQDLPSENQILLHIMEGRVGDAIDALYTLGGATGAALPSTLIAVVYSLYLDTNILPPESGFLKKEFLCEAALAIVSSLAEANPDTGTSLALQLLLPYLGDRSRKSRDEISMSIVHILERYAPRSDSGARDILGLVGKTFLEGKKGKSNSADVALAEACEAVVLCRYRHFKENGQPGGAVEWLAEGIRFRFKMGASVEGLCHRSLCALCTLSTSNLLRNLKAAGRDGTEYGHMYSDAESIVASIRDNSTQNLSGEESFVLTEVREVQTLLHVADLLEAFVIDKDHSLTAKQIIASIEETRDRATGTVGRLLPLSLHWPLLLIAQEILCKEENLQLSGVDVVSAFDQKGVSCLLESLVQSVIESSKPGGAAVAARGPSNQEEVQQMQRLLSRSLARACVVENAKKQKPPNLRSTDQTVASIRSTDLAKHPPSVQRAAVLNMLEL